ncbi:uncharacterized protein [Typha angustifolia]|uniref:uncharacterized protein n=1 Tax=Typha angustifolia TaxID=59011 RepID=UPI003C2BC78F
MVQYRSIGNIRLGYEMPPKSAAAAKVKLEVEDALDDEYGPFNKRPKFTSPSQLVPSQAAHYDLLNEPSPLGLRLRKSPSLVDLIQMGISQGSSAAANCTMGGENDSSGKTQDARSSGGFGTSEKLKAANFPASLLRIGDWECTSIYEGDLVAKFYFAKRKLVWEVLDGGLKNKIEIQWSDITALKATCPENGASTLDIVLGRQPLFFRETNPQPRKHTLWQATSDFTGGQASIHRRHFLQCPQDLLNKHFEKLLQCDPRLYSLSLHPNIILENPYFQPRCSVFEDHEGPKCHGFDNMRNGCPSQEKGFQDLGTLHTMSSSCAKIELQDSGDRTPNVMPQNHPPRSVMGTEIMKENMSAGGKILKDRSHCGQFKIPKLRPSISISDFMNHISEQMNLGHEQLSGESLSSKEMLDDLAQYLLSDSHITTAADEKSLMSRVNSLCSLIQKDANHAGGEDGNSADISNRKPAVGAAALNGESNDASESQQPWRFSRNESFGELLMNLPRIASLPQFLIDIAEDVENQDEKMHNRQNYM